MLRSGVLDDLAAEIFAGAPVPGVPVQAGSVAPAGSDAIDATGTPLEILRSLLANAKSAIAAIPSDSPRLNGARSAALAITKAIAGLERASKEAETPEEVERRRRREDGARRLEVERYVAQAEREAARPRPGAPHGVCVTCGVPVAVP